ncbi:MAG TPA: histidine kinase [Geobacter sp.]|nr:histidine kinase [Geobacter sp.]
MKINTRISGSIFLLVAALMGLLTLTGYRYLAHTLVETFSMQQRSMLNLAARHVDDELARSLDMLALVVKGMDEGTLNNRKALQASLDQVKGTRGYFDAGLEVIDSEKRVAAQSPPSSPDAQLRKRDYVAMTLATGKPYISAPYPAPSPPNHPRISFSVPILAKDGSVAGLLAGHQDLMRQGSGSDLERIGNKGRLIVVERSRTILRHPEPGHVMERIAPGEDRGIDEALQENHVGYGESTAPDGEKWITVATPLKNAQWIVAVQYPESEAYQPLKEARLVFGASLVIFLFLTQMTLCRLLRRITGPLANLIGQVRALPAKGGEQRTITVATGDELEHLALAVNGLVAEMDKRQETLEENQELYRIIANFTTELATLSNPDGTLRYISSNCLALTGYTDREFIESPQLLEEIIHPDDLEQWRHRRDNCANKESCNGCVELRLVTRQGEIRWFKFNCSVVTGQNGECLGRRGSFRDISQDRLLEGMLEKERRFAESLLENTSTPLFVIDKEHRIVVWNRAMTEMTGLPAGEMLGTDRQWVPFYPQKRPTLSDLILDGDDGRIGELYRTFSRDVVMKGMARAEGWYQNLNGKDRYLFFDAAPVLHDGETVAVVETLYDITERARAEESLRLFSRAVDQGASTILITDPTGTILYANRKFSEVSGYTQEEVIGRKPSILKSGNQPDEMYRNLWETITAGREWHGEFQNRRKDGTLFWESAIISPICDHEGKVTHFIGIKEEISARKDAERQLLKSQAEMVLKHEQLTELFRQVEKGKKEWEQTMDCIDDMVAMVDGSGKVRRCNRAFERIAGTTYRELLSSNWRDLLGAVGLDIDQLEGGSGELYHEPTRRWFTLRTYPYGDHDGAVIMLHDLTEIKLVSEQLADAYEELKSTHSQLLQQEKMASIGQLAAGVAHEINNPMGFISSNLGTMGKYLERLEGFLELQSEAVIRAASDQLREEMVQARKKFKVDYILGDARSLLAESQDGAERVRTIVQNLKSFSRVDDAQATYVDLNECLESTITIAWNELKYKTTLIRDYGELPPVKCLPQQLNQVFLNILVNAAHAIEKQGEVTVTTRCAGSEVTIAIHDTGGGIPDAIKSRIFEPFFTTKEVGKGTGLGLSISYDIIKKHNGSIEVESSPGEGTTFIIRLPIEGGIEA